MKQHYYYNALGKGGTVHQGVFEAISISELRAHLCAQELSLISTKRKQGSLRKAIEKLLTVKIHLRDLKDFYLQLKQLDEAGIPLKEGIEDLRRMEDNSPLRNILAQVSEDLDRGCLFSQCLEKHPQIFDALTINLIKVSERTGRLSFSLSQLIQHVEWKDQTHAKIVKNLRYPLILIGVIGSGLLVFTGILVPELSSFLQAFNIELPLGTRILIGIANFLSQHFFLIGGVSIFGYFFAKGLFTLHPKGSMWKSACLNFIPQIGAFRQLLSFSYFFQSLSVMLSAEIDILEALEIAKQGALSFRLHTLFTRVEKAIQGGLPLSKALEEQKAFPPLVQRMIRVGERTSTLPQNLHLIKNYFESLSQRKLDRFIALLEPSLLLIISSFIGWIAIAFFIPLYESSSLLEYQ